ncbi:MAG: class I mannose-6-phosphate isomerase [Planctomycetaceae bacterium]|nr:class I mannose-6-phosphate isomerase [Planctomycetaceae bacterium]
MQQLGPLELKPILKRIRWGGTRLGTILGKEIKDWDDAAESWEVVDHGDDQSIVMNGRAKGRSLAELVKDHGRELFGREEITQFPLLIKFLDATDRLSLQVHPNDQQAVKYDPTENGKTEAWVILDTTPDSKIWLGLKEGVDRKQLAAALQSNRIEEVVHSVTPQPGDCFFVPAGTVHAIGEGILLAEVQQSSDLTFRLHDWGRVGKDGQPRPIHVEESLDCTDFQRGPLNAVTPRELVSGDCHIEELVRCPYFGIERRTSSEVSLIQPLGKFRIVMMLKGGGTYQSGEQTGNLSRGETLLIPASSDDLLITPEGESIWLEIDQP